MSSEMRLESDVLLERLEALQRERAPLFALYGAFGTFDHTRKIALAAERDAVRLGAGANGQKITEAAIDDIARNSDHYKSLIARATEERTQLALLDAEIQVIEMRLSLMRAERYENAQLARMQ